MSRRDTLFVRLLCALLGVLGAVVVARLASPPPPIHIAITVVAPTDDPAADDEDDLDADTPFTGNTLHLETL